MIIKLILLQEQISCITIFLPVTSITVNTLFFLDGKTKQVFRSTTVLTTSIYHAVHEASSFCQKVKQVTSLHAAKWTLLLLKRSVIKLPNSWAHHTISQSSKKLWITTIIYYNKFWLLFCLKSKLKLSRSIQILQTPCARLSHKSSVLSFNITSHLFWDTALHLSPLYYISC